MFFSQIASTILFSIQFFRTGMQEFASFGFIFGADGSANLYFFRISNPSFCLHLGNHHIESDGNAVKTKENFKLGSLQSI